MTATISNDLYERGETLYSLKRFLTGGMLGTLVDITLFYYLQATLDLPTLAANAISYSAGIVDNFVLNRHWTWSQRPRKTTGIRILQFAFVSMITLLINSAFVLLLADPRNTPFTQSGNAILLAKICATGVGICWNFLVNNFRIFRDHCSMAISRPAPGSSWQRAAWSR